MRIAELSRRTGVPIPTIKYYMREGLLPQGERTGPNQARYGEEHVRRLRLARALVEVGGLPVASAREALALIFSSGVSEFDVLGKAQYALTPPRERAGDGAGDDAGDEAAAQVDELIARRGWQVKPGNPARRTLADALATLRRLGEDDYLDLLETYAETAEQLADTEVRAISRRGDLHSMAEAVVIWTALGDPVIASLRRLAQEARAARLLGGTAEDTS
ncbi:MerR family transcriptional regulator [Microbispora bryophytorum]|uniref:MerR family transcriptional regulator n=1 Tax=Microbispora bryophytorum TaxID=1460882 RepID=A0A8H9LDR7_9ACTN|nr:MerR family transcriptional regulator [Microbispora bryophytorum]MBD3134690.1 MerR family transcriptional regulator [Microbispora bryophytorum]TQS09029.1 MerR family transcriptional regulator [Microbispora bryophytorum]GGO12789.1 MerR family transcriptional regulator [Microbispora bryophytorum]